MKTYEMIYALDNAVSDEAKDAVQAKFEGVITAAEGNILSVDKAGAKRLAYPINYKTEGYFVVMSFEVIGSAIKELNRVAQLTPELLRTMITVKA